MKKHIVIVAGPNGAGKTMFAREFLRTEADCTLLLNADLIVAGLSPFAPEWEALQAGRIILDQIRTIKKSAGAATVAF